MKDHENRCGKILIVEDDYILRLCLEEMIEEFGYTIVGCATSGEESIEKAGERHPDLILMDITLDGTMDGVDAAGEINELYRIPVIFVSALSNEEIINRVRSIRPYGFILKPFKEHDLRIALDIAFQRLSYEMQIEEDRVKYQGLLECVNDAVYICDREGNITGYSQSLLEMLGYKAEEIELLSESELFNNSDPVTEVLPGELRNWETSGFGAVVTGNGGRLISCTLQTKPLRTMKGRLIGYQCLLATEKIENNPADNPVQRFDDLRKSMKGLVRAMALTVEARDPYTAGHQRRVSDLARAIASEMNLSSGELDGIRLAGTIHDLGKIHIPAEILSKPGKISFEEFSLIKLHPRVAYNILKTIDFPWPIAQIIDQHHERIDGSGYPEGLSGDDILLESKILGVADVVEAMSSHRPYRAALGLEPALDEIMKNRGVHYDSDVVDACVNLFNQGDYSIE